MSQTPKTPRAGDVLDILIAHNEWGNRELLEACRPLTREQFHQKFPIGLGETGGLHLNITHIISAAGRWADRVRGVDPVRAAMEPMPTPPPPGAPGPDARDRSVDELLAANHTISNDLRDAARHARARGLGATFTFMGYSPTGMRSYTFTYAAALTHVLTHGHYHRAQCLNMLRHLGVVGAGKPIAEMPETSTVQWQLAGEPGLE